MSSKIENSKKRKVFKRINAACGAIHSPEEFKTLVDYERTRSDRSGGVFSVVVVHIPGVNKDKSNSYIPKIVRYTRSVDRTGWSENGDITVLLPDTTKEGAKTFCRKLHDVFHNEKKREDITLSIYSYPEHWLSNSRGDHQGKEEMEILSKPLKKNIEFFFVPKIPRWKRALDLLGASFMMILFSPIFLLLTLYIKIVSPGPVLFKQTRIGYKGVPFQFLKFRTMKNDNNQSYHGKHAQSFIKNGDIPMAKLDDRDPRIIPLGRIIRKSCMDELPQLWNVIRGEMSIVGPRPCIPYEAEEYLRWHTHRFDTMPGLTGLWQVSGKNKLTFKQMIRLDITYCRNMSLLRDIMIIFSTPYAILKMMMEAARNKIEWKLKHSTVFVESEKDLAG